MADEAAFFPLPFTSPPPVAEGRSISPTSKRVNLRGRIRLRELIRDRGPLRQIFSGRAHFSLTVVPRARLASRGYASPPFSGRFVRHTLQGAAGFRRSRGEGQRRRHRYGPGGNQSGPGTPRRDRLP